MQGINKEQLNALTKSLLGELSSFMVISRSPVDPKIVQEQDLLTQIACITNTETACKARDLFHSSKNVYDFNDYLFWLSKLNSLLLQGISPDKAFNIVRNSIIKRYQEPLAIFKDCF